MIVVSGTITLDPANHDKAVAAMQTLAEATNQEEGCISYGFFSALGEQGSFRVFEEWQDQAAMDEHMASAHMAAFIGGLGDLGVTGSNIIKYEVSGSSKLM